MAGFCGGGACVPNYSVIRYMKCPVSELFNPNDQIRGGDIQCSVVTEERWELGNLHILKVKIHDR